MGSDCISSWSLLIFLLFRERGLLVSILFPYAFICFVFIVMTLDVSHIEFGFSLVQPGSHHALRQKYARKVLHIFPCMLTHETATWLLCDGGITMSCACSFKCVPREVCASVSRSWREPHGCHMDVPIYCVCLTRMSCALCVRFDQTK